MHLKLDLNNSARNENSTLNIVHIAEAWARVRFSEPGQKDAQNP